MLIISTKYFDILNNKKMALIRCDVNIGISFFLQKAKKGPQTTLAPYSLVKHLTRTIEINIIWSSVIK